MVIAHVTGFPFHLPADEQDGTIHLIGRDSNAKCAVLSPHYCWLRVHSARDGPRALRNSCAAPVPFAVHFFDITTGAIMLTNMDATATVGVRDIAAAREFYGNVLGLTSVKDDGDGAEMLLYSSGNTQVLVYRSEFAGTNKATSITWDVGDELAGIVAILKARGVQFEHYEMDGMQREGDIHIADGLKIVWLKDPDGNILNINGS